MPHLKKYILFIALWIFLAPVSARAGKSDDLGEVKKTQENHGRMLADAVQNIATLRQEVQAMHGAIDEIKHFFDEATAKNEKLLREFDYRLTAMEEKLFLYNNQLNDFLNPSAKKGNAAQASIDPKEEALYKKGLSELNLQRYRVAAQVFDQFLKKYPKSSLADNAQYWKAETLYASKDYPNAILEFQNVVKKYPKSNKVPSAILKQGYSFFEMKNDTDAKIFLQKVISDFPSSEESGKAEEKIQKIEERLKAPQPSRNVVSPSTAPMPATQPDADAF